MYFTDVYPDILYLLARFILKNVANTLLWKTKLFNHFKNKKHSFALTENKLDALSRIFNLLTFAEAS